VRSNSAVQLDPHFITPVIHIADSSTLSHFTHEVHGLLQQRAEMLAYRLNDIAQSASSEAQDFMLLQLVNRYEPLFHYFSQKADLTPESWYTHLVQLLGELSSFTQDNRRAIIPPVYQHAELNHTLQSLMQMIRDALSVVLEQNALSIELNESDNGLWMASLTDNVISETNDYILAVYAEVDKTLLAQHFVNQTKIASVNQIRQLVSRALPGIDASLLAIAPRQIPSHANFCYFMLNTTHDYWQDVIETKQLAIHIGAEYHNIKLELWAIKG